MNIDNLMALPSDVRLSLIDQEIFDPKDVQSLIDSGKLDIDELEAVNLIMAKINLNKLKHAVLAVHPYKITPPLPHVKRPRFVTYIPIEDSQHRSTRKKIAKSSEEALYSFLFDFYSGKVPVSKEPTPVKIYTLESLYPEWMAYKKRHSTNESNLRRLDVTWRKYYAGTDFSRLCIKDLSQLDCDEWVHSIIKCHHMDKKKYDNFATILRQMLDYAVLHEIVPENLFRRIRIEKHMLVHNKRPAAATQVFSEKEVSQILELAQEDYRSNHRLRYPLASLAVIFQILMGLRVGELCALKYQDIEGEYLHVQRMIRLQYDVIEQTKSSAGNRWIPLTPLAQRIIEESRNYHLEKGQPDAPYIFGGYEHLKPRTITDRYDSYCRRLNILKRSSHKARKTYISELISSGMNLAAVSQLAGHEDPGTTLKSYYFDRSSEEARSSQVIATQSSLTLKPF